MRWVGLDLLRGTAAYAVVVSHCAASLDTISRLAAEGIPVVGHVGLVPCRATWTGGFKAVGKTAATYHIVNWSSPGKLTSNGPAVGCTP